MLAIAALAVAAVGASSVYVAGLLRGLPNVEALKREQPGRTSYMRLRAVQIGLSENAYVAGRERLQDFAPLFVCAVVKAEDPYFFRHRGFDWRAVRESAMRTLRGTPMGASTITQQLARNLYLGPERTIRRKLSEALIARDFERELGKRRILTIYLNSVEWGDGVWGAAAASRHYFAKAPSELDAFESSFLVSLLAAPRRPLSGRNLRRAWDVQHRVANELYKSGLISAEEWAATMRRAVTLHAALAAGTELPAALRLPVAAWATVRTPTARRIVPPLSPQRALDEECGLTRELSEPGWDVVPPPAARTARGPTVSLSVTAWFIAPAASVLHMAGLSRGRNALRS